MRILGVDPGSRFTGYGCIESSGTQLRHITHGTLKVSHSIGKTTSPIEERLLSIHQGLSKIILEFRPDIMAVEKVFFAKNALSALILGQARGAVLLTGKMHALSIYEYSPTEVKQAVVGHGRAEKEQVAKMVQLIVGQHQFVTYDASDGLALAICHAFFNRYGLRSSSPRASKKKQTLAESLGHCLPRKTEK